MKEKNIKEKTQQKKKMGLTTKIFVALIAGARLGIIICYLVTDSSFKKDVIVEAKEYIRQYYNQNITLNDISKQFFINPYYFSQLFKKKTGMTYQNYLISYRIDRAKKLLAETDLRIYEVCKLVGYNDVNHFNQVFERSESMKPSEFRQRYKQEEDKTYEF